MMGRPDPRDPILRELRAYHSRTGEYLDALDAAIAGGDDAKANELLDYIAGAGRGLDAAARHIMGAR